MKLFPASASTRALEAVASHAYDAWKTAPTAREQREIDTAEYRDDRCRELAGEALEACLDLEVHEWLARDANREDVQTLAVACIRQDDDLRRLALQTLIDRYVDERAHCYAGVVDEEMRVAREEWEADAAWERTHG